MPSSLGYTSLRPRRHFWVSLEVNGKRKRPLNSSAGARFQKLFQSSLIISTSRLVASGVAAFHSCIHVSGVERSFYARPEPGTVLLFSLNSARILSLSAPRAGTGPKRRLPSDKFGAGAGSLTTPPAVTTSIVCSCE